MGAVSAMAKRAPRPKSRKGPAALALAAAGAIGMTVTKRRRDGAANEPPGGAQDLPAVGAEPTAEDKTEQAKGKS
jgi:hypothetical protein